MKRRMLVKLGILVFLAILYFVNTVPNRVYDFHSELSSNPSMGRFVLNDVSLEQHNSLIPYKIFIDSTSLTCITGELVSMRDSMSDEDFKKVVEGLSSIYSKHSPQFNNFYFSSYSYCVANTIAAMESTNDKDYAECVSRVKEGASILKLELVARVFVFYITLVWALISIVFTISDYRSSKAGLEFLYKGCSIT